MALTTTVIAGKKALAKEQLLVKKIGELQTAVTDLTALANDLKTKFNAHVHVENAAGTYAQSANTAAPTTTCAVDSVTL